MTIKFDKRIYKQKAIRLAMQAYQELAVFNLSQKGKHFQVELRDVNKDIKDTIKDEFANYVLSLTKV